MSAGNFDCQRMLDLTTQVKGLKATPLKGWPRIRSMMHNAWFEIRYRLGPTR